MGFVLGKAASGKIRMPLIAWIQSENREIINAIPDYVQAVMVEVSKADDLEALDKVCDSSEKVIAGGWLRGAGSGILKKAFSAACDFMVFPPATAVNMVPKEKTDCILELDADLDDGLIRAVNDLPVEAVLVFGKEVDKTITLSRLMQVQRVTYLVSKPVLMCVSSSYSETEMQALWDAGISAAVLDLSGEKPLEKLAYFAGVIEKLTPPALRKKDRIRPILPHLQAEPEPPQGDEEEEEDE